MNVNSTSTFGGTKPFVFGASDSYYIPDFLSLKTSNKCFKSLLSGNEIQWYLHYFFNNDNSLHPVQRLSNTQYLSDDDSIIPWYRYPINNQQNHPQTAFTPSIINIAFITQQHICQPINHCVINLYRNGNDFIPYHNDNTLDIKNQSVISTISLGATRLYVLQSKTKTITIKLQHGSLLILGPKTNQKWKHSIIKDANITLPRISITMRYIATYLNLKNKWIMGQGEKYQDINYPLAPFNNHKLKHKPDIVQVKYETITYQHSTDNAIDHRKSDVICIPSTIHCVYTINDSHFHGMLMTLNSIEHGKKYIEQINARYKNKAHAPFVMVFDETIVCNNDEEWDKVDVGRNLLKIMKTFRMNKVLIVVVRHWIGTYLGLPKLLNAYSLSVKALCLWYCKHPFGNEYGKCRIYRYNENKKDVIYLNRMNSKL
eukprot:122943_1